MGEKRYKLSKTDAESNAHPEVCLRGGSKRNKKEKIG